jgi:hypothetical protein
VSNGSLPPVGHPLHGGVVLGSADGDRKMIEDMAGGQIVPSKLDDPGNLPPRDEATTGNIEARVTTAVRQIPLVTVQHRWSVAGTIEALAGHMSGMFEGSSQLWDAICGDPIVQATVGSRVEGLTGAEQMVIPSTIARVKGSRAAKECADAWRDNLQRILTEDATRERQFSRIGMGFALGSLLWDRTTTPWIPMYVPFVPRFMFWHWTLQRMIAITLDGTYAVFPGDGTWVQDGDYYRSWIRGTIRAVAEPWLILHFANRDWANFSEVHGQPWRIGKVPAAASPDARTVFKAALENVGHGSVLILPQGVDTAALGYEAELLEATDAAGSDSFDGLINQQVRQIVLAVHGQNLTTEVSTGSLAAARVHEGGKQSKIQSDERAEALATYQQIARPFAQVNYGDADLAPITRRDIEPIEDYASRAVLMQAIGAALQSMRAGGVEFTDEEEVRRFIKRTFGLHRFPKLKFSIPTTATVTTSKESDPDDR